MRGSPISSTLCLLAVASAILSSAADTQKIEQKPAVPGEKYNYAQVLYLSILFYEAQRSGKLPANNRIPWREDSALHDGKDVDRDLTGGWYDAGDFVKFGFPMAFSTTTLAWGLLEYWDAYVKSGELQHMLDCIKWPLDFLVKAHAPDKQLFFVQIGDGVVEHEYWGPPETEMTDRPSYDVSPQAAGSEPTAEAAAAMAAGYMVFKDEDAVYADVLLHHSRILFDFAYTNQGSFNISEPFYKSWTGYKDELAWAALWLYKATGEAAYLAKATAIYTDCCSQNTPQAFGWDNKGPAVRLLLYKLTRQQKYADDFSRYMDTWLALPKTPKGLAFYLEWGPLRYSANTAFLALVAADYGIKPDKFRAFAVSQIHYILGDCCGGVDPKTKQPLYSYVIGYGNNYPHAPHHRAASCQGQECDCSTSPHPHTLYGAMVGGPDRQDDYLDDCQNYMQAEVATDYNAGLQGAVAALKHLSITKQLPSSP